MRKQLVGKITNAFATNFNLSNYTDVKAEIEYNKSLESDLNIYVLTHSLKPDTDIIMLCMVIWAWDLDEKICEYNTEIIDNINPCGIGRAGILSVAELSQDPLMVAGLILGGMVPEASTGFAYVLLQGVDTASTSSIIRPAVVANKTCPVATQHAKGQVNAKSVSESKLADLLDRMYVKSFRAVHQSLPEPTLEGTPYAKEQTGKWTMEQVYPFTHPNHPRINPELEAEMQQATNDLVDSMNLHANHQTPNWALVENPFNVKYLTKDLMDKIDTDENTLNLIPLFATNVTSKLTNEEKLEKFKGRIKYLSTFMVMIQRGNTETFIHTNENTISLESMVRSGKLPKYIEVRSYVVFIVLEDDNVTYSFNVGELLEFLMAEISQTVNFIKKIEKEIHEEQIAVEREKLSIAQDKEKASKEALVGALRDQNLSTEEEIQVAVNNLPNLNISVVANQPAAITLAQLEFKLGRCEDISNMLLNANEFSESYVKYLSYHQIKQLIENVTNGEATIFNVESNLEAGVYRMYVRSELDYSFDINHDTFQTIFNTIFKTIQSELENIRAKLNPVVVEPLSTFETITYLTGLTTTIVTPTNEFPKVLGTLKTVDEFIHANLTPKYVRLDGNYVDVITEEHPLEMYTLDIKELRGAIGSLMNLMTTKLNSEKHYTEEITGFDEVAIKKACDEACKMPNEFEKQLSSVIDIAKKKRVVVCVRTKDDSEVFTIHVLKHGKLDYKFDTSLEVILKAKESIDNPPFWLQIVI